LNSSKFAFERKKHAFTGRATIEYIPLTMCLVVRHTPDVQEQISDLLAVLRGLSDLSVALDIRLVTLPADSPTGLPEDAERPRPAGGVADTELKGDQVRRFLATVQTNARASVLQIPTATVPNYRSASIKATEFRTLQSPWELTWENGLQIKVPRTNRIPVGICMFLYPVDVTSRSVCIDLDVEVCNLDSEPSLFKHQRISSLRRATSVAVVFPDVRHGETDLLDLGQREQEVAPEPIPFLSDLPLFASLLREIGSRREVERVFLLVTPRIIFPK
jgi:hypothetical protein